MNEATGKSKQIIKTLGYYPSRRKAEVALNEYLDDPYNIGNKDMTFEELYKEWSEYYFATLSGVSSVRTIMSAYRYMHLIYKMKVRDIRVRHLEGCLEDAYIISDRGKDKGKKRNASACVKARMKSVFNLMFDYAVRYDIVKTNYARNFEVSKEIKEKKKREKKSVTIFSNDELMILWDNVDKYSFVDMILIGIYSGWRPQELAILKVRDVDLDGDTFLADLRQMRGRTGLFLYTH